jgi:hypothetical protein
MGFDNNDNLKSMDKNLGIFKEYTDASLSGNSNVFNDSVGKHNRYFATTGDMCMNPSGDSVNRNILIDNMNFVKTGSTTGLLPSAMNDINKVEFDDTTNDNTNKNCVSVTIVTDSTGNTDTANVSMEDYEDIDCTAFPKNCKPRINKRTRDFIYPIACEKCINKTITDPSSDPTSEPTDTPFPSGLESFVPSNKCKYCDNSIHKNNRSSSTSDFSVFDNYNSEKHKKDPAVTVYITSISILGLYLLYKMLYVKH